MVPRLPDKYPAKYAPTRKSEKRLIYFSKSLSNQQGKKLIF